MQEPSNLELNYPVMVWTFYRYGALLVAMETTVCIRSCLNFKNNILLVSYFHISHKKFENEYVYFKDKFWPKSPVVKYSPTNRSYHRTKNFALLENSAKQSHPTTTYTGQGHENVCTCCSHMDVHMYLV